MGYIYSQKEVIPDEGIVANTYFAQVGIQAKPGTKFQFNMERYNSDTIEIYSSIIQVGRKKEYTTKDGEKKDLDFGQIGYIDIDDVKIKSITKIDGENYDNIIIDLMEYTEVTGEDSGSTDFSFGNILLQPLDSVMTHKEDE